MIMDNAKPSRNWFGHLTVDNIDDIVAVLKEMLDGQKYTFVSMGWLEGLEPRVDVRTSQSLKGNAFSVYHYALHSGFNVGDSYGVWGVSTAPPGAFISFEHWKVTIKHESASGNKLTWIIATEQQAP